ncbi:hypothetical protein N7466_000708 [Penicillium verhagenii]|uniref:uncharacterized protein n=1 Tax=Penicillium verhagenii TaxID=1562060 RepID=UPI002544DCE2|nr:uncharacterized protein N7466_000708 [Penicillium verhagenii]KAJ5947693.1 hypothetical protein N7466_000708 [Penicillium verhagenii]
MSSADPTNSPDAVKRSRYTCRHLQLLRQGSTATPLRAIAHIDLDAFYAQCEMVRLGIPRDTPLAVRQWQSLIAVNYAARAFGITRMVTFEEAQKLCPNIILQHVATFREGEGGRWAYRDDSFRSVKTDKVSLDPYRAASRKILQTMKDEVQRWCTDTSEGGVNGIPQAPTVCVEKASVDEVFIDLSPLIYSVLLQRYPELRPIVQDEKKDAELPCPPTTALQWGSDTTLIDLDLHESEEDDPDWDDVVMMVAAEITKSVRTAVWEKLQYTCSAGVSRNKMLAKLGSACNKPDKQTVVRNRAVQKFLGGYKFTQIRMLGGKLGDQVTSFFGTEQVSDLLNVSLEQLRAKLDDDTAAWLYNTIRGEDRSEVNPRTQIKSMLSAKSFRPSINSIEQAEKWLHIFAADIYGRLVEDGVLENRRRPRIITIHHRVVQSRSRQIPIPGSNTIDEKLLFELAKTLLRQVVSDGQAWPCANLSLSVSSFEDGVGQNNAITGFLVRGDQTKSLINATRPRDADPTTSSEQSPVGKKRKIDNNIKRFFNQPQADAPVTLEKGHQPTQVQGLPVINTGEDVAAQFDDTSQIPQFTCERCDKSIPEYDKEEHEDWHFAKDLATQDRQEARDAQQQSHTPTSSLRANNRGRGGRSGRGKSEKGQMRLAFQ